MDPAKSIATFFAGRSVFITGATGFMGKILVEKLLRSCPDIREIFLLLRPKKGITIDDRLRKLTSEQPFDKVRTETPALLDKLIPVTGDITEEELGIPDMERRILIDRVSIIFHGAASVRFDDNLKTAVQTNLRSVRDICILAAQMKNLKAFVHVSTTYCQADKLIVEEKLYETDVNWKKTLKIIETVDDEVLKAITSKYIGNFPNTYTFSKRLAEQVINDYSHVLPCVVFRPSVVINSLTEPEPGWMDNFNGPVGLLIGGGKGILRVAYSNPRLTVDFIPVDEAIRAMIIACWKRGIQTITRDPSVHVYNCSSGNMKRICSDDIKNCGFDCLEQVPLEGIIWAPRTEYTMSETHYFFSVLLFHILPAIFIDGLLKLSGKKPMLIKLHRRVYIANKALAHFLLNGWIFKNSNLHQLAHDLPIGDEADFKFNYIDYDVRRYFIQCLYGAKKYLLNEDITNLEPAKQHLKRIKMIDRAFRGLLLLLLIWLSFQCGLVAYITTSIDRFVNVFISD